MIYPVFDASMSKGDGGSLTGSDGFGDGYDGNYHGGGVSSGATRDTVYYYADNAFFAQRLGPEETDP